MNRLYFNKDWSTLKKLIAIKAAGGGAPIVEYTATGNPATFETNVIAPMELLIPFAPVQGGNGDPSPENIRPISGWTGAKVTRNGFNAWDEEWELGDYSNTTGGKTVDDTRFRNKNYIPVLPNKTYYANLTNYTGTNRVLFYDKNKNYLSPWAIFQTGTFTTPSNAYFMNFFCQGTTYNNDISINYPSTETNYHAYVGYEYSITFPSQVGTVYGGKLTVNKDATGTMVVDRANIASYNGETLPSTWISDRDVYAQGTTPTTGAQVVYELATPVTYQLTDIEVIETLKGVNNVWSDTNGVNTIKYMKKG